MVFNSSSAHLLCPLPCPASPRSTCTSPRSPRFVASYASSTQIPSISLPSSSSSSHYEILGLSTTATCQEIKTAYRKLARVCHPDVVATDLKDTSATEFMKIYTAYSTLSDPGKRANYDQTRQWQRPIQYASPYRRASSFNGSSRRTWETDQCW